MCFNVNMPQMFDLDYVGLCLAKTCLCTSCEIQTNTMKASCCLICKYYCQWASSQANLVSLSATASYKLMN